MAGVYLGGMRNTRALENVFFNNPFFGVLRRNNQMFRDIGCDYCFWTIHFRLFVSSSSMFLSFSMFGSSSSMFMSFSIFVSPSSMFVSSSMFIGLLFRNRQSFPSAKSRDLQISINTDNNKVYNARKCSQESMFNVY